MALILAAASYLPPGRLGWLGPSKMHPAWPSLLHVASSGNDRTAGGMSAIVRRFVAQVVDRMNGIFLSL
jgi:hypothetical protein